MLGATLFLSGCGIYTKYEPQTSVPDQLYGEEVEVNVADTTSIGSMDWRELFKDPRLQALIEKGLENNTDLRTAQLRVEEAKASLLAAKLSFLPGLSFSPQGTISSFNGEMSKTYTVPVTASWELDIFGKLRNAKKQAAAAYAQSEDYQQAVRSSLIANIANTYYTLLMLDEQLALSEETAQSWKETVRSTQALMNAGLADESSVSQMTATYYEVRNSVVDLKEQINQVENSLALLLAETPHAWPSGGTRISRGTGGRCSGPAFVESSGCPSGRAAIGAGFLRDEPGECGFYPSITLSGSAGWTNSGGAIITNPGEFLASAVASLTQPLFNRGALIAQKKIAKAQQEEASLAFQQKLLDAGSEVNEALVSYQVSKEKRDNYECQIASLRNALRSTSQLMEHGNTTYLEVLTAKQTLLSAQLSQVANRFKEIQSVINLYQALGGGANAGQAS